MKDTMIWLVDVLKEINKQFPQANAKPNITLPNDETAKDCFLIVSFMISGAWYAFGIVEDDRLLTPEELISQVKKDLEIK